MKRTIITALALFLAACSPQTEQEKSGEHIRQYLMDNPDITLEIVEHALRHRKSKADQAKAGALETARAQLSMSGLGSVSEGQGDITLVEFFDYRCGYCKRAYPALMAAVKKDRRIRVIYREFRFWARSRRWRRARPWPRRGRINISPFTAP